MFFSKYPNVQKLAKRNNTIGLLKALIFEGTDERANQIRSNAHNFIIEKRDTVGLIQAICSDDYSKDVQNKALEVIFETRDTIGLLKICNYKGADKIAEKIRKVASGAIVRMGDLIGLLQALQFQETSDEANQIRNNAALHLGDYRHDQVLEAIIHAFQNGLINNYFFAIASRDLTGLSHIDSLEKLNIEISKYKNKEEFINNCINQIRSREQEKITKEINQKKKKLEKNPPREIAVLINQALYGEGEDGARLKAEKWFKENEKIFENQLKKAIAQMHEKWSKEDEIWKSQKALLMNWKSASFEGAVGPRQAPNLAKNISNLAT